MVTAILPDQDHTACLKGDHGPVLSEDFVLKRRNRETGFDIPAEFSAYSPCFVR